ncbi:putative F-box protein At1g65770 [Neltuma alba]|uniref:putative F-box protein At1g65770 n=1 Tax=Neltuma alba TaxID=207710 RepID=UPI0010A47B40|nr:putative F-box protein At1g65770 [Prosopis alba]
MCAPAFLPACAATQKEDALRHSLSGVYLLFSLVLSMDAHSPSWSGLRTDLLLSMANRLDSRIDRLCFRVICYPWRSVLPPPSRGSASPSPPLKLPFPMGPNLHLNPIRRGYFNLTHSTVYCLQSLKRISDASKTTECWFIKVEETKEPGNFCLTDPLSWVSEITKVYDLQFVGNNKIPELDLPESFSVRAMRVAVCSECPASAVMAIHTAGQLSIWRKGDKKWICISDGGDGTCYDDVAYHNGKFYAVDTDGLTISIDVSLNTAQVVPANASFWHFDSEHRVPAGLDYDSDKDILPTYFHVYKLIEDKRKWVPVKSLGDRAIFVGEDCAFSVSAQEFRGCKKNCIYFNERDFLCGDLRQHCPGGAAALFDMGERSAKMLSGVSIYSGLFWPPSLSIFQYIAVLVGMDKQSGPIAWLGYGFVSNAPSSMGGGFRLVQGLLIINL